MKTNSTTQSLARKVTLKIVFVLSWLVIFPIIVAAGIIDIGDPVAHQHRRQGQLRIAGSEKLTLRAGDKIVVTKGILLQ